MPHDLEIARSVRPRPILDLAGERLDIPPDHLIPFGHTKAKVNLSYVDRLSERADGKLILVTAISPTPAGEGKTTATVGLGDSLARLGQRVSICLREPSLGPVFGMKGGAAGGGYSQVIPMEDINLHFTGDFSAIALANNLLSAMIDNHIHQGNVLGIDQRRVTWRRVVDMNDRALRQMVVALGGVNNGIPREDGFDIVVASEVMAIFCLATSLRDLKERLSRIVVASTWDKKPVTAGDLKASGAMAVLLKDALAPNLVQTLENTPAFVHGGPFANIAHGCNSVMATRTALKLSDIVVTEAGFGADLGAEKFLDIKCRQAGLWPHMAVLVATARALKFHGGKKADELKHEDVAAVERGLPNLLRHIHNLTHHFGLPVVVCVNPFDLDSSAELECITKGVSPTGVPVVVSRHWAEGSGGSQKLGEVVMGVLSRPAPTPKFLYPDDLPLVDKIQMVATRIYGAGGVELESRARKDLESFQKSGFGRLPVCIAKTPYSFSTDPSLKGAPDGHTLDIREVRLSAGAGFVVAICGEVMTMPGLPRVPAAERMDLTDDGQVIGLS